MARRALISVYDKSGLEDLLPCLSSFGFEIIASGGTATRIRELGCTCIEISQFTGYPESPRGLVKTLHPKIHGGLLLDPDNSEDSRYMREQGIVPIELLIVNLYPFEKVVSRKDVTLKQAAENIDIGGQTLIRAAAKAALLTGRVSVLIDPTQYKSFMEEMKRNNGEISNVTRRKLAREAFALTSRYDLAIREYLSNLGDA
jgi:phosphoribosylaminoimidazolecarboxamide formyltransferase/IMP cyclohydrolase